MPRKRPPKVRRFSESFTEGLTPGNVLTGKAIVGCTQAKRDMERGL